MTLEQLVNIGNAHHKDMVDMGWSNEAKSNEHYVMLTICEMCEAIQAHRKGHVFSTSSVPESYLEEYCDNLHTPDTLFKHTFEYYVKDTTMDEMADVMLRLLALTWLRGWESDISLDYTEEGNDSTFTERSLRFVDIITSIRPYRVNVLKAIAYINNLASVLDIDLYKACIRKMRYNRIRSDWKNNEKSY